MRALLLFFLLAPMLALGAEHAAAQVPTYGKADKGSIRVLVSGHAVENVGYYHLASNSLAAFIKEDKARISRLVHQVRIIRKEGEQEYWHTVKLKELMSGKDFVLREGDTLLFVTTII